MKHLDCKYHHGFLSDERSRARGMGVIHAYTVYTIWRILTSSLPGAAGKPDDQDGPVQDDDDQA
jgi:hypothetical protein